MIIAGRPRIARWGLFVSLLGLGLAPAAAASRLTFAPAVTRVEPGASFKGVVTLDAPAAETLRLALTSSHPATAVVPAGLEIAKGGTSATFPVNVGKVAADTVITLTVAGSGVRLSASFTALAPAKTTVEVQPPAAACSATTTCSGHGVCDSQGRCVCSAGFSGGNCGSCAASYYNYPSCAFCQASATCTDHGSCNAAGACLCTAGFSGPTCAACAPNYYGYPTCRFCSAATTCNGHGACNAKGSCVCQAGFTGVNCEQRQ